MSQTMVAAAKVFAKAQTHGGISSKLWSVTSEGADR